MAEKAAQECIRLLKERFDVKEAYLFGSLRGDAPWHEGSDIDIAVEGLPPERYFEALSALWKLIPEGIKLDLVALEEIPPEFVSKIKGKPKEVWKMEKGEAMEALKVEIETELRNLKRIADGLSAFTRSLPDEPDEPQLRALGSYLHDFYCGVERIFERIAVWLGPGLPMGERWHTLLLRQMESEIPNRRPAVIDHPLALRLVDYLRFRHLFRYSYGYELSWDKMRPLVEGLPQTLEQLCERLEEFWRSLEVKG